MRPATSRWCSAPWIWAATRCCPMPAGSGRKIPRWAGAPSASRSIARRLLRYQVRALLNAGARAHPAHPAAHGQRRGRIQSRPRPGRPRDWNAPGCSTMARPTQVLVGAMLEVPALAFMLPQLMRSADFVSIGSNDLLSLAFAVDRTNPRVSPSATTMLNPASLTLIRLIVNSAAESSRRPFAVRRDGGPAAGRHGADGSGHAHPVHAAGQDRPGQDDDPQPAPGGGVGLRGQAVRPDRSFLADPALGLRRRARELS